MSKSFMIKPIIYNKHWYPHYIKEAGTYTLSTLSAITQCHTTSHCRDVQISFGETIYVCQCCTPSSHPVKCAWLWLVTSFFWLSVAWTTVNTLKTKMEARMKNNSVITCNSTIPNLSSLKQAF